MNLLKKLGKLKKPFMIILLVVALFYISKRLKERNVVENNTELVSSASGAASNAVADAADIIKALTDAAIAKNNGAAMAAVAASGFSPFQMASFAPDAVARRLSGVYTHANNASGNNKFFYGNRLCSPDNPVTKGGRGFTDAAADAKANELGATMWIRYSPTDNNAKGWVNFYGGPKGEPCNKMTQRGPREVYANVRYRQKAVDELDDDYRREIDNALAAEKSKTYSVFNGRFCCHNGPISGPYSNYKSIDDIGGKIEDIKTLCNNDLRCGGFTMNENTFKLRKKKGASCDRWAKVGGTGEICNRCTSGAGPDWDKRYKCYSKEIIDT